MALPRLVERKLHTGARGIELTLRDLGGLLVVSRLSKRDDLGVGRVEPGRSGIEGREGVLAGLIGQDLLQGGLGDIDRRRRRLDVGVL